MCIKAVTGDIGEGVQVFTGVFTPRFTFTQLGSVYISQVGIYSRIENKIAHFNFSLTVLSYMDPSALYLTFPIPEVADNVEDQYVNFTCFQGVAPGSFTPITVPGVILAGTSDIVLALNFELFPGDQWQGNFYLNLL